MNEKTSILIVDDDESTRRSLTLVFGRKGYEIETAETGQEAIEKARERSFNLALLDIKLPDMEGVELIAPLRALHPDMVVVMATAYASVETATRALHQEAYAYVTKPLNIDEMLATLRRALEKQRLIIENRKLLERVQRELAERKRAEEEIRRHNRELELLNRVIAASASGPEPEMVLETACRELARAFNLTRTTATLMNEEKTAMVIVAEHLTAQRPSALSATIPLKDDPLFRYLSRRKGPLLVTDARNDPRLAAGAGLWLQDDTASLLMLPLIVEGEMVGMLNLDAEEQRHFSAEEVSLAWSVADQVAGAVARVWLSQTHRRLITATEQTAESVVITDTGGTILYVNPGFERATGYSRSEVVGQNPRLLKSGKHHALFYRDLWATITAGKVWQGRFVNKKKDGTLYTDEATISPVRSESGAIVSYVSVQKDVTRELELEEQYRQAQKMEAIGQLTGGIAHDFNNVLTAINGFAELLQRRLPAGDPVQNLIGNIRHSAQRAADLVKQLLAFSRKQIIEPKVLNLNTVLMEMDRMLQRIIGEDIQMKTVPSPDLWPVKVDPAQVEQVVVNLAVNARDAMPEGGWLTIETANVILDQDYVADHLEVEPGEYVLLAISDTGIGMSESVKAHIFEPFFTTKEQGKGTGLGLATVFGIVRQNGGHIRVYSEKAQGTTIKVYLPRVEKGPAPATRRDRSGSMPRGTETVLLVEDDPAVQDVSVQTLRQQGYTVLKAANGQEALHLAQAHDEAIDLLFTDVVMPYMNGKVLADQIRSVRSEIRVLFASGYTDSAIVRHGVLESGTAFIQKPFTIAALAHKVRQVLDESPRG